MTALSSTIAVGVIGAGTMGSGIAQVAATAGHPVFLFDARDGAANAALSSLAKGLEKLTAKGKMTPDEATALVGRITPVDNLEGMATAGLVVEAIVEDLAVKRDLFKQLEALLGADAILATNTSSLSVTAIGAVLADPSRMVGMHFFNPAQIMRLVEVVRGLATSQDVAETVFDTALAWGKSPVYAASTPGFIVNRVARPYYAEALRIVQEGGTDPATVDAVLCEGGGFRMGPFAVMDLIGNDVNYAVTCSVFDAFSQDPRYKPSLLQRELVDAGYLGRKSGRGWFDYADGAENPKANTAPPAPPPARLVIEGGLGAAEILAKRIEASELTFIRSDSTARDGGGRIILDDVVLRLTDGRSATERAEAEPGPLVLFDLAHDYAAAGRIAIAKADQTDDAALAAAAGLFQAIGIDVSIVDDVPGLIVMRTVAMLANEGLDAVLQGVTTAKGVDIAMMKGVSYPRGPINWAERISAGTVLDVLDNLARIYGDGRYRASALLRRRAVSGGSLTE